MKTNKDGYLFYSIIILLSIIIIGLSIYIIFDDDDLEIERGQNHIYITGPEPNGNASGYIDFTYTVTNSSSCIRQIILMDDNVLDAWITEQNRIRPDSPLHYNTSFLSNDQHHIEIICFWSNYDYSSDYTIFYVDNS